MDVKLFLSILDVHDVKINYEAVAQRMATEDAKPTAKAINHRMAKLKAAAKKLEGGGSVHFPHARKHAEYANMTPRSTADPNEETPKPASRKRGSIKSDGDGDDDGGSAQKARKAKKIKNEAIVEESAGSAVCYG